MQFIYFFFRKKDNMADVPYLFSNFSNSLVTLIWNDNFFITKIIALQDSENFIQMVTTEFRNPWYYKKFHSLGPGNMFLFSISEMSEGTWYFNFFSLEVLVLIWKCSQIDPGVSLLLSFHIKHSACRFF